VPITVTVTGLMSDSVDAGVTAETASVAM